MVLVAGALITSDLSKHFYSLAPPDSAGVLFVPSAKAAPTTVDGYLASPQLRVLLYQYIAIWLAKVVTDVGVLYHARYRMSNVKDAEFAVKADLIGTIALSIMFSFANVSVAGTKAVFPAKGVDGSWDWSQVNTITSIHLWGPLTMIAMRLSWLFGVGREKIHEKTE